MWRAADCCPESVSDFVKLVQIKLTYHSFQTTPCLNTVSPFGLYMPSELKRNVQRTPKGQMTSDSGGSLGRSFTTGSKRWFLVVLKLSWVFSQQFPISCHSDDKVSSRLSHKALEPFFSAFSSIYSFIVTFMSFVQGHCWVSQYQLQPGGRQGTF